MVMMKNIGQVYQMNHPTSCTAKHITPKVSRSSQGARSTRLNETDAPRMIMQTQRSTGRLPRCTKTLRSRWRVSRRDKKCPSRQRNGVQAHTSDQ